MGYQELIEALRKEGEEKIHTIWKEAEAETQRIREESLKRLEGLRAKFNDTHSSSVRDQVETILSEAATKAKMITLLAEKELSERLYRLAVNSLPILRNERYKDIFSAMVKELPPRKWEVISVNAEDLDAAKGYFPDAEIIADSGISGGLDATGAERGISVINTFEKRLERAWPQILPVMVNYIRSMI